MRSILLLMAVLALSACKPSEVFGPGQNQDELMGGDSATVPELSIGLFPSGKWKDGLGNAWMLAVSGSALSGTADSESLRGLTMTGSIQGNLLIYDIGFPDHPPIAHGTARLTDVDHAQFETLNADGTLNAHGLLHFNHPAQTFTNQPVDLRPAPDCPQSLKGD